MHPSPFRELRFLDPASAPSLRPRSSGAAHSAVRLVRRVPSAPAELEARRRWPSPCTPPQIRAPYSPPLSCVWQCCVLLASCLVSCPPHCLSHGCPGVWAFCLLVLGPSLAHGCTHRALCSAPERGAETWRKHPFTPRAPGPGVSMQSPRLSRAKPSSGEGPPAGP